MQNSERSMVKKAAFSKRIADVASVGETHNLRDAVIKFVETLLIVRRADGQQFDRIAFGYIDGVCGVSERVELEASILRQGIIWMF